MGLFTTLNTGVSGLNANSVAMNVIGDNIANVNTTGFKSSRAAFEDILAQNIIGSAGTTQLGHGAILVGINMNYEQGTFENTTSVTDLAINGQGFFVVRDSESRENLFTRSGQMFMSDEGYLVNSGGLRLQGYNADSDGDLGSILEDINIPTGSTPPSKTTSFSISANLSADTEVETDSTRQIDTSQVYFNYEDLEEVSDFSTTQQIYDSLGESHDVTLYFQKVSENEWTFTAVAPSEGIVAPDPSKVTGDATALATGTLVFNPDGTLNAETSVISDEVAWGNFKGAEAQAVVLDFSEEGSLTHYGDQDSTVTATSQDGYSAGYMSFMNIERDGSVVGIYSNGQRRTLAQVALATFQSVQGLERRGGNLLGATGESLDAVIAAAGTGGRGGISSNSLESSNVDLESEFVHMIATQLGYQANSRVISTTNEMLQQLLQLA